jgi:TnpA family transposase
MGAPYNTLKNVIKINISKKKSKNLIKKLNQKQKNKFTVLSWNTWIQ